MISSQENREDSDIPLVADSDSEEEAACAPQPPVAAWKQAAEVRPASELSPCWRTLVTRAPEQELDSTPLAADSDSDSDDEAESAPQAPSAPPQKATKTIPQLPPQPQLPQLNLGGSLAEQLASCKERMQVLEKLLSQSQWQNQVADSQNQALRKQVDQFSWEIQKLRTRERIKKVDAEVQTETYATWSHSDYTAYSQEYYYPSTDVPVNTVPANLESKCSVTAAADQFVTGTSVHTNTSTVKNGQKVEDPDAGRVQNSKEEKAVSLAEMLRVTAEAVVSQTGFTFDEATGLYYDHNTGYYYDSENQLYYDANSGIYYSCDAETGNYVFHSRVDLPASQTTPQVNKNVFHSRVNRPASQTTPQVNKDVFHSHVNRPASQTTPQVNKDVFPSHVDLPASQTTPQVNKEPNRMLKRQKSWDEDDYENELILDENTGIYSYRHPVTGLMMFHSHVDDQAATYQGNNKIKVKKQRPESSGAPANEVQEIKTEGKTAKQKKRTKSRTVLFNAVKEEEPVFENGISDGKTLSTESLTYVAESGSDAESSEDEGEIVTSDVEKECSDDNMSADMEIGTDSEDAENEEVDSGWPPCIRVIVVRSPDLETGTLFIITSVQHATIGSENNMEHAIHIPEQGVSKFHAEVYFDHKLTSYVIVDQGSENGTIINGSRIFQPSVISAPCVLEHGDELKFGETVLSFHMHPGSQTCLGCEPGQIQAFLGLKKKQPSAVKTMTKEAKRRLELKLIRQKYGLQNAPYEECKALKNPNYVDRAGHRRKTVGSEGTFQRDDAPASVHVEITESNKGHKMLKKMGWKKGEGLGKYKGGIKDPIQLQIRKKKAGLGAVNATSIEDIPTATQNKLNWEKARERFAKTFGLQLP